MAEEEKVLVIDGGVPRWVNPSDTNILGVESGIPSEFTSDTSARQQ